MSEVVGGVESRLECEELCLLESEFRCASAGYSYTDLECSLSRHTRYCTVHTGCTVLCGARRSRPASWRATTSNTDYLENQCARSATQP